MVKNPIQSQKVYVTLASVLEIQANFNRLVEQVRSTPTQKPSNREYARGMAQVIRILGLPIDISRGF
jgi:hypothetical protein